MIKDKDKPDNTFGCVTPRQLGPFHMDTIQMMDCVQGMKQIPSDSVDVVIADPPYNASKGGLWKWDNSADLPGFGGAWSKIMADWDDMPLTDYFSFTIAWLREVKRIVRPTGSIWVHGTFHNIGIINFVMQLLDIEIINEVIWYKRNSFPNLSGRRLTASHETILWAHTGGKKRRYYFDYEIAKSMQCLGDNLKMPGKQMRTIWDIPNNKKREEIRFGKHPAQKPLRLLKRMLRLSTKPSQLLLTPFAGAGSECVAAKELGIHFIGFENDPTYHFTSEQRLTHTNASASLTGLSSNDQMCLFCKDDIPAMVKSKPRRTRSIPSLIKWTGSKRAQALRIVEEMPEYRRYFEPFLGSGALLYLAAHPGAVSGDIYEPLVELWRLVQTNPQSVISDYKKQWVALQHDSPRYYYDVRNRFNSNPNPLDLNFLTRTCVNGIIRFNQMGEFNNSFHLSRKGMQPDRFAKVVADWHKIVRGVRFVCQDYAETLSDAREDDFVYLDPPYAGNNMRYTADLDMQRFWSQLEELNWRKVKWALSFDGQRGELDLSYPVPESIYVRKLLIPNGNSPIGKVLNGPIEQVYESLYLNY